MNAQQQILAETCLAGAEDNAMTFPEIVGALTAGGFESYCIDMRLARAFYYLPSGECVELPSHQSDAPVSATFDAAALQAAIREAQQLVPGYTYKGFCLKAKAAGCAGYLVSFPGRRAVYFGRSGEVHTEHFPTQA